MSTKASRAYNLHDTVQDQLALWNNDYTNVESAFNYSGVSLVDPISNDVPQAVVMSQSRRAAYHAFLIDTSVARLTASLIIPTYGQPQVFAACLESIARQTLVQMHPKTIEIIIVEGGIPKGQKKSVFEDADVQAALVELRSRGISILRMSLKEELKRSMTRNIAIANAKNEVLFFIDNSMILEKNFLVDHMMRHHKYDGPFALLGFKENLNYEKYLKHRNEISSGSIRPDYHMDWKYSHTLKSYELPFEFEGKSYKEGDSIKFMELTKNLRSIQGGTRLGKRTLATFFQTNVISVRRSYVRKVGGFEGTLSLWGLEDSLLGARLIAITKCFMVPCPSSVAFNLQIEKEEPSSEEKEQWLDYNRSMYNNNLARSIREKYETFFKKSVKNVKSLIDYLEGGPRSGALKKKKLVSPENNTDTSSFDLDRAQAVAAKLTLNSSMSTREGRIEIRVKRHELRDIVAAARLQASSAVISVVGDLSWVEDELPAIREVRQQRPSLRLCIFYNGAKVRRDLAPILLELRMLGVELRPYPNSLNTRLRCMLIDPENRSGRRVGWITHAEIPNPAIPRDKHEFLWHMVGMGEDILLDSVQDFVEALSGFARLSLNVGIIGVNNVGKTKFAQRLKANLDALMFKTRIVPDIFHHPDAGTTLEANYAMLSRQIISEVSKTDFDISIFDRTSIDNYCYLCMRANQVQIPNLHHVVVDSANAFDILIDVNLHGDVYPGRRKHVTAEQRIQVRNLLNEFEHSNNLEIKPVILDAANFATTLDGAANSMAEFIHLYSIQGNPAAI